MLQLQFSPFPQLNTKRAILRQLTIADADAIAALRSDPLVNQYLDRPKTTTPEEAVQFIEKINLHISNNIALYWVIALQENDQLIGTICLWNFNIEEDTAEIGYELLPDFQGKGFMQEALQAVIDYACKTLQLKTITAFTVFENIPSIKLLQKNNFVWASQDSEEGAKYILKSSH